MAIFQNYIIWPSVTKNLMIFIIMQQVVLELSIKPFEIMELLSG